MQSFRFYSPTDVRFGRDVENSVGEVAAEYGRQRVLIVTGGGSAIKSGLMDRVCASLDNAGIQHILLKGVKPNPELGLAREGVKMALDFGADLILAVGGGSAIDTAKLISHGAANPDVDVWDYWLGKALPTKTIGVAAIPTIAAAGSELSDSAVITDEQNRDKRGLNCPANRPIFALINPTLLATLPKYKIGCGCADIFMHTMERFFSDVQGNHLTDKIAAAVMQTVLKYSPVLLADPTNYEAQSEIFWASELSHNDLTGLGSKKGLDVHKLGHRLSADFGIAHGASLTCLFGSWARVFKSLDEERFCKLGREVFGLCEGCTAEDAICAVESFFSSLGMPVCFGETEFGILSAAEVDALADRVTNGGKASWGSFGKITMVEAKEVYRLANH